MRILLIGERADHHNGGANRVVVETLGHLASAGHAVGLVRHHPEGPVEPGRHFRLTTGDEREWDEIYRNFRPEVVQVHHLDRPQILGSLRRRAPVCVFFHDQTWICPSGDRLLRGLKPCHRRFSGFCLAHNYLSGCGGWNPRGNVFRWRRTQALDVVRRLPGFPIQVASQFMRRGLEENAYEASRIDVVPLFATPPSEEASPNVESGLVLLPSRLVLSKGVHLAIQAMGELKSLRWRLVIAGGGSSRGALEGLARRLGLSSRVDFLGEIGPQELSRWYGRTQLVLFPVLRAEPFGLVGVEALAHGKPIVAIEGGAVDEWLFPGETGLAVRERTPLAFAGAVRELLLDAERCATMGKNARRRFALFRPEAYVERLVLSFERTRAAWRAQI